MGRVTPRSRDNPTLRWRQRRRAWYSSGEVGTGDPLITEDGDNLETEDNVLLTTES